MNIVSAHRYLSNLSDSCLKTNFSKPRYVSLIITKRCNLKCGHCDIWKSQGQVDEIQDEQWLDVLGQIKRWLGKAQIEINGGEPLFKKDLVLKIIKKCQELNLPVALNTNGTLIDQETAHLFFNEGLSSMKISLYSLVPEDHDRIRGVNGAFLKAKDFLDKLAGEAKIEIGTVLIKNNLNEIQSLVDYAQKNNFNLIFQPLDFNLAGDYQENWQKNSEFWPDKEQIEKYLKPVVFQENKAIKNPPYFLRAIYRYYLSPEFLKRRKCLAFYNNIIIELNGDLKLCFRSKKVGNIGQAGIKKIWQGQEARQRRRELRLCQKSCKIAGCNIRKQIKDFLL